MNGIALLALRVEPTHEFLRRDARALGVPIFSLLSLSPKRVLTANARWLRRAPGKVLSALLHTVRLHRNGKRQLLENLALFPVTLAAVEELERSGIRHVHACWATHAATSAWVFRALSGGSYSLSVHAFDLCEERQALRAKMKDATAVVACSEAARKRVQRSVGEVGELHVVRHGLDLQRFVFTRSARAGSRVLFVGRLVPKKGILTLVRAAHLVARARPDSEIVIAGPAPDRRYFHRLRAAANAGPARHAIVFPGWLDDQARAAELARATVFVHPGGSDPKSGDEDGVPNTILESMAVGLPVVAGNSGGIGEAVKDGETGTLVNAGDELALARAVLRVLEDPVTANAKARAARLHVQEHHDCRVVSRRLAGVLTNAASRAT
jgi:glycosyltransferase involved in cell wall biosynthesis